MYGYIFITINKMNGKKYIGQSTYKRNHAEYIGSGKILRRSIKKHGKSSFIKLILYVCKDKHDLNYMEIHYINLYNAVYDETFYNLASGGQGGNLGPKVNKLISEKVTGSLNGMYRRPHSEKAKELIRNSRIGKTTIFSNDSKKQISNTLTKFFSENRPARDRISEQQKSINKNRSVEDKNIINDKRSRTLLSHWEDNTERKAKMSDRMDGINNPMYGVSPAVKGTKWFCHPENKPMMLMIDDPRVELEGWRLGRKWK